MKEKPYSLELSEDAESDFDISYEYYLNESPKAAYNFFNHINLSLENIGRTPLSFPEIWSKRVKIEQ